MDTEVENTLDTEKVGNGAHFHSVQFDTIREDPDAPQMTKNKLLSRKSDPGSTGPGEVSNAILNSDPDGGYGWVIVMASFFVAFIVDGIGSSFGLLFPHIQSRFDSSAFVASFAGSLFVAFLIMGSISAELVKRFGFRAVTVAGGALSCVAFVASVFSPNIYVFLVTYGLLGGCSCGLVFIPSIIIVNEYFHQRRGIANGIISSGSGVGLLVLAPVINIMLEAFSLNGTVLILAGILLNMCVFSCLYRPPVPRPAVSTMNECDKDCYSHLPLGGSLSSSLSADNVDYFSLEETGKCLVKDGEGKKEQREVPGFDISKIVSKYCHIYLSKSVSELNSCGQGEEKSQVYMEYMLAHLKSGVSLLPHHYISPQNGHPRNQQFLDKHWLRESVHWKSGLHIDLTNAQPITKQKRVYSMYDIPAWCQDKEKHHMQSLEKSHRHPVHFDHHKHHQSHRSSRHHSQNLSIEHGSSLYLAGSISTLMSLHTSFLQALQQSDLRTVHSRDNISSKLSSNTRHSGEYKMDSDKLLGQDGRQIENVDIDNFVVEICVPVQPAPHLLPSDIHMSSRSVAKSGYTSLAEEDNSDSSMESRPISPPLGYSISQLLCMPSFHLFCLGASLIQIGYPLAGTFLADYAYQFGLNTSHTAVLMSLLGGLNVCGRLLAGVLVSLKADPLLLNNVSLLLGGVACLMSPLYTEFWSLCMFAGMFGFFLGFFPPLQPLIIVKFFGLDSLASAFGFLSTIKGVASILGAPLAGFIYDVTGQYSMSFIFGGVVFVLSAFVHCVMTCACRCCGNKKL